MFRKWEAMAGLTTLSRDVWGIHSTVVMVALVFLLD
jgi:hypothetical protein